MERLAECRSVSPYGEPCVKARGHQGRQGLRHRNPEAKHEWTGGIRTRAYWCIPESDYFSEGDYQSWMRYG